MKVAFDIDGTIDAFPELMAAMGSALQCAGHVVVVISGVDADVVCEQDVTDKEGYLTSLGFTCYDAIYVTPHPHDDWKARLVEELGVDLLVDNDSDNADAASSECAVLVLWNALK